VAKVPSAFVLRILALSVGTVPLPELQIAVGQLTQTWVRDVGPEAHDLSLTGRAA